MKKTKKYDAVAEVRKIRDKMSRKYRNNPDLLLKDLKKASEEFDRMQEALKKR
ncbi:hypothetical protein HHL17_24740 [Chitinophaga sp. G-6-1-13]|uniref:Uncharacterized protein n=1 Tax=Chitinophaga fulva TaxID=2728842 RepID=A0A848GXR3_9BACT|nr:hypothetical protein [Chitinophaga fulva]NML40428.1 hypothetical protein [Chitinophaga fulva]